VWHATLKGLLAHRWRLLRTASAVALGVGFLAGTLIFTDTMGKKIDDIFTTSSSGIDVQVRAKTEFTDLTGTAANASPVPESVLPLVERVEGVDRAWGSVWGYAQMLDKNGKPIQPPGPPTLGGSWEPSTIRITTGRPPRWQNETAIDDATARKYGFSVGDRITVLFQGPSATFLISGIFEMPDSYMGATIATFSLETAQRVLNRQGSFDAIAVRADPGISETELARRVAAVLPLGFEAVSQTSATSEAKQALDETMGIFRTALLVFALVALFVGAFIIFNTFSILVAQRTRELGLLRAVGASRAQITASVLIEAVVVGLIASAIGIVVGLLLAYGIVALLSSTGLSTSSLRFAPRTAAAAALAGVLVTVVSALMPARRATQVPPIVAIGGTFVERAGSIRRRVVLGSAVTAAGVAALLAGLFGAVGRPLVAVGVGALCVFLGVAMLSALIARPLAALVGAPFSRAFGQAAYLGRQNSMRNPRRTASTAAALMIGVGLVGFVTITAASIKESVRKSIDETMAADFMLEPQSVSGYGTGVNPELASRLRATPGIGLVSQVRVGQWGLDGELQVLTALDPLTFSKIVSLEPRWRDSLARLSDEGVLVSPTAAEEHGWKVGDQIQMQFPSGTQSMRIDGLFEWEGSSASYTITLPAYERIYPQQTDTMVGVLPEAGWTPAEVRGQIGRVLADFPTVKLEDKQQFTAARMKHVDTLLAFITALLFLSIVIALLGIANTLALSIFERTRELGLLRAVGMSRAQLRSMVRWEAIIIGVIGALLGLAVGVFFGWVLVRAMRDQGVTEFAFPAGRLALYVLLAAVAGVIASVLPARRAAKLNILEAIAFE